MAVSRLMSVLSRPRSEFAVHICCAGQRHVQRRVALTFRASLYIPTATLPSSSGSLDSGSPISRDPPDLTSTVASSSRILKQSGEVLDLGPKHAKAALNDLMDLSAILWSSPATTQTGLRDAWHQCKEMTQLPMNLGGSDKVKNFVPRDAHERALLVMEEKRLAFDRCRWAMGQRQVDGSMANLEHVGR